MSDGGQVDREVSGVPRNDAATQARRTSVVRWARTSAVCLGVAGVITVAGLCITATKQQPSSVPAGPQAAPPPVVSNATTILPAAALPATVEQLGQEARRTADDLRDRFPNLPEALHVAAMCHALDRRTEQAERLWRRCIELDSKHAGHYVNLAAVALDRGDSGLAEKTLREAVRAGVSSPDLHHHLAISLANLGRCEEAEGLLKKALAEFQQVAALWLVLGETQLKLGKPADAETSLRRAMALGSRSAGAHFALANACARQGKNQEAAEHRKIFEERKAAQPLDKQQRFQILSLAEARRNTVTILREAAAVHLQQKNSLESESLLLRAMALDPFDAATCGALAALYEGSGMLAERRVVLRRLVEIEPSNPVHCFNLASVSAKLGDAESAEAALKLGVAARPQASDGYAMLAQFYLQAGRPKQARWFAQEALRREPSPEGYEFLASTCRALGNDADAEAALVMARKLERSGPRPAQAAGPRP